MKTSTPYLAPTSMHKTPASSESVVAFRGRIFAAFLSAAVLALSLPCNLSYAASNAKTSSKTSPESTKELTQEKVLQLFQKALQAERQKDIDKLAEQIDQLLAKGNLVNKVEGQLYALLALLHVKSDSTALASSPFLTKARLEWPELGTSAFAPEIWKHFKLRFAGGTPLEERLLSIAALALDGRAMMDAGEDPSYRYFTAVNLFEKKKQVEAFEHLQNVPAESVFYRRAKFLESILFVGQNRIEEARKALQIVVSMEPTSAEKNGGLSKHAIVRLRELAVLNLARLSYEEGEFLESLTYYRTLMHDSNFFFESLSEQAWPFFMAGYPNRAMGSLYAATSPFFQDRFNPDSYFLGGVIYYWMCQFDSAKKGLAKFVSHTRKEGDELKKKTNAWNTLQDGESLLRYASVFENARSGVSSTNLGIGPRTRASMLGDLPAQESYAALQEMVRRRLKMQSDLAQRPNVERVLKSMGALERDFRIHLGTRVKLTLSALGTDFEDSLAQARVLYLEILTAQKDRLLGGDRTVKGTEFVGEEKQFEEEVKNSEQQRWEQDKNEFWYDELGNYVFQIPSQCQTK